MKLPVRVAVMFGPVPSTVEIIPVVVKLDETVSAVLPGKQTDTGPFSRRNDKICIRWA